MKRPVVAPPPRPSLLGPVRLRSALTAPRIGRRGLLGLGVGAALAPFVPVLSSRAQPTGVPKRILFWFQANGTIHAEWRPEGDAANPRFRRILAPLERHKQDLAILSGIDLDPEPRPPHSGHAQLFSNVPADLRRSRLSPAITLDQFLADERKDPTRFRTVELGIVPYGGDRHYAREVLFRGPYDPVPWEPSPYAAFDRLFGASTGSPELTRLVERRKSVLDGVRTDLRSLSEKLGREDRALLDRHHQSIRDLELRFGQLSRACDGPEMGEPLDYKSMANYREMAELQTKLMVAAFACDATRIGTLIWSGPTSTQTFPWLGNFRANHHRLSHDSGATEPLIQIYAWYSQQLATFIDSLKAIPEADGTTAFDNTVIISASPLGDGNRHRKLDLPLLVAGGRWHFATGRHLTFDGAPHGHLLVSLAQAMGVDVPTFGQPETSQGPLPGLAA